MRVSLSLFAALLLALPAERKQGNPLDHLPPNFEVLTHFGERADISPDNLRVAFMAKSFGDAMVIDLKTREMRCLTCNVPAAVFLLVMHLVTGDYRLIRHRQCEELGGTRGSGNIDIWKLKLDGTGKDFTRLTYFNDYAGGKASNPVISTDGRFMAFQVAKTDDPAGVGYGILLFHFPS